MLDPYICLARCFSTWWSLKLLMFFTLCWCVIMLGLSGWLATAAVGDLPNAHFAQGCASYATTALCDSSPYYYLRPFSFTYTQYNGTVILSTGTKPTTCPWPVPNSSLRFTITVFGFVTICIMYVKTILSIFARYIWPVYGFLFFCALVLDSASSVTGKAECNNAFVNTKFNTDLVASQITIQCIADNFNGLAVVDIILSFLFFLLHTAWGMCTNHYEGKQTQRELEDKGIVRNDEVDNDL